MGKACSFAADVAHGYQLSSCSVCSEMQPCKLYVCEAAAIQKEMQMAVIMNIAALKLCCKEANEQACAGASRPQMITATGKHLSPRPCLVRRATGRRAVSKCTVYPLWSVSYALPLLRSFFMEQSFPSSLVRQARVPKQPERSMWTSGPAHRKEPEQLRPARKPQQRRSARLHGKVGPVNTVLVLAQLCTAGGLQCSLPGAACN